ncbi:hypothetical protein AX17_003570 [Amanita inopinata Kibby_2008]|nr:hypothetical protein AX17_003570 [Amanita inopinata Kibby_2008]
MAVLSLPLTFNNSFWSQDYRHGIEVLYQKLEQGVAENDEITAFIRARIAAEVQLAASLSRLASAGAEGRGFSADDGASLLMAFRGLQAESITQGKVHDNVAKELNTLVLDPFSEWAEGYRERLRQNKANVLDNWLRTYEQAQADVQKLKQQYLAKTRRADDAEDDAKFAPNTGGLSDNYTTSPRMVPVDTRQNPQRTSSVSERITHRLREIQKKGVGALSNLAAEDSSSASEEQPVSKIDKGKGKAVEADEPSDIASPRPMSPLPPPKVELASSVPELIVLGSLSLTPAAVSQMLTRAASDLPLRPVRFPLLGEYQDAFSGEEFVTWLQESVKEFEGNIDVAEDAARVLTEQEGLLRRLGEFGNQFEGSDDAFYQFRPKAFDIEGRKNMDHHPSSSIKSLQAETLLKRTNNFVSLVTKALNNNSNGEPLYIRARHEAEDADKLYRVAVRKLDRHRLAIEERLEETLRTLQRWETERLRAIKTVLLQYQGILANIPKAVEQSNERSGTLIAAYQPESDLNALIERYRTGPFRPTAQLYESISHDEADVVFGIDLRKWAEGGWHELTSGEEKKELLPPVITALFSGLEEAYSQLPNNMEKRKSWIYEVPLPPVHQLREVLNAIPAGQSFPAELFKGYGAPVIASTIKLWILELDPPLATYEGWEEFRKLYPIVGSGIPKADGEVMEEQRIQNVSSALQRLPKVHLHMLEKLIKHLRTLIESTNVVEESDEVYIAKLALSLGRTIIRPKQETELSIQDRHPNLLFIDLVGNYEAILPPTIARKKRESERKVPIRKRTAPVDMRLSRSRISLGADAKQLLAAQQAAQNPSLARVKSPEIPPVPPLPPSRSLVGSVQRSNVSAPSLSNPESNEGVYGSKPFIPPPPPPTLPSQAKTPSPQLPAPSRLADSTVNLNDDQLPKSTFRESPPALDDIPPRPMFKEPPPEVDDYTLPPMPKFVDPPVEESDIPAAPASRSRPESSPKTNVTPPTSLKRRSLGLGSNVGRATPSNASVTSRSPSPPDDVVLGSGKSNITRSGSAQSAGTVRGPRLARGPARRGGTVANAIANLNRSSISGAISGTAGGRSASPTTTKFPAGSPTRRPSSVLGRSAALARRTMTSDAEDDLVDKK